MREWRNGRRAGFRHQFPVSEGSTPFSRTTKKRSASNDLESYDALRFSFLHGRIPVQQKPLPVLCRTGCRTGRGFASELPDQTRVRRHLSAVPCTVYSPVPAGTKTLSPFFTGRVSPEAVSVKVPSPSRISSDVKDCASHTSRKLPSTSSTVKYSHCARWPWKSWGLGGSRSVTSSAWGMCSCRGLPSAPLRP